MIRRILNWRINGKLYRLGAVKTSELENDSGFLTQHQDISGKADTADLAAVATSGSYNDLSHKPTIPTAVSDLSDDSTHRTVTDTEKATWNAKGTYSKPSGGIPASDLAAGVIPTVPQMATAADMSDWTSGKTVDAAVLKADFQNALAELDDVEGEVARKANASDIPTAVSDLTNDSGYQTAQDVQTAIAAIPAELPAVTASDNGKFLRVVSGAWAAQTVPSAESNSFGGGA